MPRWISARWFTGPPWRLAVNQAGRAFGVEARHPIAKDLLGDIARQCRLVARPAS